MYNKIWVALIFLNILISTVSKKLSRLEYLRSYVEFLYKITFTDFFGFYSCYASDKIYCFKDVKVADFYIKKKEVWYIPYSFIQSVRAIYMYSYFTFSI